MKKIKFYDIITVIIYIIGGSLITFNAGNLFFSDISNYASGSRLTIIATFPHFMFMFMIITLGFFFVRYRRLEDKYRLHFKKYYFLLFMIFSAIGVVTSILSGTIVYGSFLAPYPFNGAVLICFIIHLLILAFSVIAYTKNNKKVDYVIEKMPYKKSYIWLSIAFVLFAFVAFYRLGASISAIIYTDYRYFAYTFLFYFSCIIPMVLLLYISISKIHEFNNLTNILFYSITLLVGLICAIYVISEGTTNPLLISLISPAMPLERLATLPMESVVLYGLCILVPFGKLLSYLIKAIRIN